MGDRNVYQDECPYQNSLRDQTQTSAHLDLHIFYQDEVQLCRDETRIVIEKLMPKIKKLMKYVHKRDTRFCPILTKNGSYWQHLKVSKADEFDFGVKLNGLDLENWISGDDNPAPRYYMCVIDENPEDQYHLPGWQRTAEVVPGDGSLENPPHGCGYVNVENGGPIDTKYGDVYYSGNYFSMHDDIIPLLVKRRLQNLFRDAQQENIFTSGEIHVNAKINGPAICVKFMINGSEISVDFAPVIAPSQTPQFPERVRWPRLDMKWPNKVKIRNILDIGINIVAKKNLYWTESFYEAEKELVRDIDNDGSERKKVHRIMKKINYDIWCNTSKPEISSYDLKNLWFWTMEAHPNTHDWTDDKVTDRFLEMTQKLLQHMKEKYLPLYFDPVVNLFATKKEQEMNIAQRKIELYLQNIQYSSSSEYQMYDSDNDTYSSTEKLDGHNGIIISSDQMEDRNRCDCIIL